MMKRDSFDQKSRKRGRLYEGKAKILYATDSPDTIIQRFKDHATAFNGQKKENVKKKGILNAAISTCLMEKLAANGIPTHLIRQIAPREQLVRKLQPIPLEIVVRSIAAGSLVRRFGIEEGVILSPPVVEYYYKSDPLADPMLNETHIAAFASIPKASQGQTFPFMPSEKDLKEMTSLALQINQYLSPLFLSIGLKLVDLKLEFGHDDQTLILIDEISPDTCRLWDAQTDQKYDKDLFRYGLGDVSQGYTEIARRLEVKV